MLIKKTIFSIMLLSTLLFTAIIKNSEITNPENKRLEKAIRPNFFNFISLEDHLSKIEQALKNGANPNHKDSYDNPMLIIAIEHHDIDAIKLLLEYQADPNLPAKNNVTPLHKATPIRDPAIMNLLIKYGAQVNNVCTSGKSILYWAVISHNIAAVEILINHGANIEAHTKKFEFTPLMIALSHNKRKIMQFLIKKGARLSLSMINSITSRQCNYKPAIQHLLRIAKSILRHQNDDAMQAFQQYIQTHSIKIQDFLSAKEGTAIITISASDNKNPRITQELCAMLSAPALIAIASENIEDIMNSTKR